MKKLSLAILSIILLFFSLAGNGWGATYYAEKIAGTVRYKAGAWPTAADTSGTLQVAANASTELVIGGGVSGITYVDADVTSSDYFVLNNGITVRAAVPSDTDYASHSGPVTWELTAKTYGFRATDATATIKGFTIRHTNPAAGEYGAYIRNASAVTIEDMDITGFAFGLYDTSTGTVAVKNSFFSDVTIRLVYKTGSGTLTGTNSIFYGSNISGIVVSAGIAHLYNSVVWGVGARSIWASNAAGSINLKNSIVGGSGFHGYRVLDGTGAITADYCNILPNATIEDYLYTGDVTITNSQYVSPKWQESRRQGFFSIVIDDSRSYAFFKSLADATNVPITFAVDGADDYFDAYGTWEELSTYLDTDDVACNSLNHPKLTVLDGVLFSSTRAGANVAISMNRTDPDPTNWSGTITLSDNVNVEPYVINIPADATSLAQLETLVDAYDSTNWTVTLDTGTNANLASVHAVCIDDFNAAPTTTPLNQNKFWYMETVYPKYLIEQALSAYVSGWTCDVFIHPYNDTSADLRAFLADDSNFSPLGVTAYKGARGAVADEQSNTSTGVDLYNLYGPTTYGGLIGTDEIERDSAALGEFMAWSGGVCVFYGHVNELSVQNWLDIIAGVKSATGNVFYSLRGLITDLRSRGTVVDRVCTVTWDDTYNFIPLSTSPANGAGTIIDGIHNQATPATDILGRDVLFTPNIGAYDGRTSLTITEDDYAPADYAVRAGATLILKGGGHVDLSGLADTDADDIITVKLKSKTLNQFTPNGTGTVLLPRSGGGMLYIGR